MEIILESPRLYLRNFISGDAAELAKIFADEEVMRYIGTGVTLGLKHAEASVKKWPEYEKIHGFTNWAVIRKDDGALAGKCGFNLLPDDSDVEIAYLFAKQYWGMGYATEIASAALNYGLSSLGLKRIAALVYPQNTASIRVLEKIGLKFEKNTEFWGISFRLFSV
jgi:ribosomal-protein-alanine N-acetyltransferase